MGCSEPNPPMALETVTKRLIMQLQGIFRELDNDNWEKKVEYLQSPGQV